MKRKPKWQQAREVKSKGLGGFAHPGFAFLAIFLLLGLTIPGHFLGKMFSLFLGSRLLEGKSTTLNR